MEMKGKMMKRMTAVLVIAMSIAFYTPVQAEQIGGTENEIMPLYDNISNATVSLSISDGKAKCVSSLWSKSKKNLSITMTLQKQSGTTWKAVATWSDSDTSVMYLTLSKTKAVTSGKYRVKAVFKAGTETVTKYSSTKTR